ncbi:hypothetical protein BN7_6698 [Wickerhamomyces ciferrii]|uniref:Protein HIR n=1 Tax=Wickerhamomyces ciferrii (strain ATCC 14091 / BCRC 22168 / CBS 111 / JCM 3599 / NBRC 0793 / NRRL Y-1031 F-60-10) TaxID=1206466 RepID=K0L0I7_WICCF|nr:uncharacterized protein BN7_6698 [Wickerhamomyces ciferrii]CCH47089.1 hypothetical protein BN7_6698 [Wickerhamomyces ciferrii]
MHILKLPWLCHEVYSLTISPDGSRLASGGLDGKVRIWSVADILRFKNPNQEKDESCKPLCSMSRHTGAVTVVKFSPDGRFLASGSDDKVLLIWEKDEESRPVFGEAENAEHWTVTKRVVAHENDIQDMAWAPDSSILVTVGLDRSIIIWNGTTFERIKRFDVHSSLVKGVVFDPANKYFATSSDDRSVRIFRYHKGSEISFSIEKNVLQPFKKSPLTTYFRRLSWSPDGQHIAAPNATNGPVTSTAIINRGTWDSDISLIGHDSPCEVACFSPVLYQTKINKEMKVCSTLATGGQDKTLVIWNTASASPVVVLEDIFYKTITDLCWTPNGDTLFASSLDGTIGVVCFEKEELGQFVPTEKTDEILNRYGVDKESTVFAESTNQLILEEKAQEYQKTLSDKHMDRLLSIEQPTSHKSPSPAPPPPPPSLSAPPPAIPKPPSIPSTSTTPQPTASKPDSKLNKAVIKNGKKRVAPTLISSSAAPSSSSSNGTTNKFKNITVTAKKIKEDKTRDTLLSKTPYSLPKFGVHTSVHGYYVKRTVAEEEEEEEEGDEIDEEYEEEDDEDEDEFLFTAKKRKLTKDEQPILPLKPSYDSTLLVYKRLDDGKDRAILEVENYEEPEDEDPSIVIAKLNGELSFETFLRDRVLAITGELHKYWILATESCAILIYSFTGRLLYPRIELGFNVGYMTCKDDILMILTEDYMIHSFNLNTFTKLTKKISLAPILNYEYQVKDKKTYIQSKLADLELKNGQILAYLKTNETYLYNNDLKIWTKIIDNFHHKFNKYDYIWVDRFKPPYITQDFNDYNNDLINNETKQNEFEYINKLTFLEGYKDVLAQLGENDGVDKLDKDLETHKQNELYKYVRT